jgi:hypothetical protein
MWNLQHNSPLDFRYFNCCQGLSARRDLHSWVADPSHVHRLCLSKSVVYKACPNESLSQISLLVEVTWGTLRPGILSEGFLSHIKRPPTNPDLGVGMYFIKNSHLFGACVLYGLPLCAYRKTRGFELLNHNYVAHDLSISPTIIHVGCLLLSGDGTIYLKSIQWVRWYILRHLPPYHIYS